MIVKLEQKLDMQEIIIACLFGSIFIIFSRKCMQGEDQSSKR